MIKSYNLGKSGAGYVKPHLKYPCNFSLTKFNSLLAKSLPKQALYQIQKNKFAFLDTFHTEKNLNSFILNPVPLQMLPRCVEEAGGEHW